MSRSKLTRLTLGPATYDPVGPPALSLLFSEFRPNNRQEYINLGADLGGFGNLNFPADLTRKNVRRVAPTGRLKPSVGELLHLLPWALNTAGVGANVVTYTPGLAALPRFLEYTDVTGLLHRLLGCVVSRATFAATAGRELTLDLEVQGADWTHPGAAVYPNWDQRVRFLFGDLGLLVGGAATPCRSFRLTVDHAVQNDRFYFGFTSAPLNTQRSTTLALEVPYGLAAAARAAGEADGGVPVALELTGLRGGVASRLRFDLPAVRWPTASPDARIPDEQFVAVEAECFGPTVPGAGGAAVPYTGAELTATLTQIV